MHGHFEAPIIYLIYRLITPIIYFFIYFIYFFFHVRIGVVIFGTVCISCTYVGRLESNRQRLILQSFILQKPPDGLRHMQADITLIIRAGYFRAGMLQNPRDRFTDSIGHQVADMKRLERVRVSVLHHYFFALQSFIFTDFVTLIYNFFDRTSEKFSRQMKINKPCTRCLNSPLSFQERVWGE